MKYTMKLLKKNILIVVIGYFIVLVYPKIIQQANLTQVSAVLSNPHLSKQSAGPEGYSKQSGSLTVSFVTTNPIPANGIVKLFIPAPPQEGNDGIPDTGLSTLANGFDLNNMTQENITCAGEEQSSYPGTWTTGPVVEGSNGYPHTISCTTSTPVDPNVNITLTIHENPGLLNPLASQANKEGTADTYRLNVRTYDKNDILIDSMHAAVGAIGGLEVSVEIPEVLSFTVEGVAKNKTVCDAKNSADTTNSAINFGKISYLDGSRVAAQLLSASTNITQGYIVRFYANNPLTKTDEDTVVISETNCDNKTCTHLKSADWEDVGTTGLGYSLENVKELDARFNYNELLRTFSAKQIPSLSEGAKQHNEQEAHVMSHSGAVEEAKVYVCYKLAVPALQKVGQYTNKITYIAMPAF